MKKFKSTRRKALKSIAVGSGAVVAGKSMPESWSKPVIDSVLLPAHAATTTPDDAGSLGTDTVKLPTGTIICASLDVALGQLCGEDSISFSISGSVSASDGSSLEGVGLTVAYTNQTGSEASAVDATVTFSVLVGPGNVFSASELVAEPPAGSFWNDPVGTVVVTFTDPAYGPSSCTQEYICGGRDGPIKNVVQ